MEHDSEEEDKQQKEQDKTDLAMQSTIEYYGMRVAPRYQRLHQWGSKPIHHRAQMRVEENESESDGESDENDSFDEQPYETNTDDYT